VNIQPARKVQDENSNLSVCNQQARNHPSFLRRFTAFLIDLLAVSAISATGLLILSVLSSNLNYQYHYSYYGHIFPVSICISLLSPFVPWLNFFNIGEAYKATIADPMNYGHMPEVLLVWTAVSLNIVLNLAYLTLTTNSRMNATFGQKCLGLKVLTLEGNTVRIVAAFFRSITKLTIWTFCSLFYFEIIASQKATVFDFVSSVPTAWIFSVLTIACFDKLEMLKEAKLFVEQAWQRVSNTETIFRCGPK